MSKSWLAEKDGKTSWTRVVGLIGALLPVMTWCVIAVLNRELPSAQPVVWLVGVFVGGKVIQKPMEK